MYLYLLPEVVIYSKSQSMIYTTMAWSVTAVCPHILGLCILCDLLVTRRPGKTEVQIVSKTPQSLRNAGHKVRENWTLIWVFRPAPTHQ